MNYYAFEITPRKNRDESPPQYSEEKIEILTAVLSDLPFDSFEEIATGLKAFMPESDCSEAIENQLIELSLAFDFRFEKIFIPYQNWNETWESNFRPIQVDDFVGLRADFHAPTEGVIFDLIINPKMAFGTGHHETTFMMMKMMRDIGFDGKKVLDYGCGTGVLAILASKLGGHPIEAVDIEVASFENTIENCRINEVDNVVAFCGTLDKIESTNFDVILANINRNVLLFSLDGMKKRLNTRDAGNPDSLGKGVILLSGFLKKDETIMRDAIDEAGFTHLQTIKRGDWLCMKIYSKVKPKCQKQSSR